MSEQKEEPSRRFLFGCSSVILLAGLLFLAAAWFGPPLDLGRWRGLGVRFSSDLVYTTGTIIRLERGAGASSRSSTTIPVVEFPIEKGKFIVHGTGSNSNDFEVGQQVPVAYRKSNPETAYIRTFGEQYAVPLLMLLFAAPLLSIGIRGMYVVARKR